MTYIRVMGQKAGVEVCGYWMGISFNRKGVKDVAFTP